MLVGELGIRPCAVHLSQSLSVLISRWITQRLTATGSKVPLLRVPVHVPRVQIGVEAIQGLGCGMQGDRRRLEILGDVLQVIEHGIGALDLPEDGHEAAV